MHDGIIIFGASGTGKTTLGAETAQQLQCKHLDLDDYLWRWDTKIPFTIFRTTEEIKKDLTREIERHPRFIMSGGMGRILRDTFFPLLGLAVFLFAPTEIRMERLRAREFANYGERTLEGGDMYELTKDFFDEALKYDTNEAKRFSTLEQHEEWIKEFTCPVLRVDGTKPIAENARWIADQYRKII